MISCRGLDSSSKTGQSIDSSTGSLGCRLGVLNQTPRLEMLRLVAVPVVTIRAPRTRTLKRNSCSIGKRRLERLSWVDVVLRVKLAFYWVTEWKEERMGFSYEFLRPAKGRPSSIHD